MKAYLLTTGGLFALLALVHATLRRFAILAATLAAATGAAQEAQLPSGKWQAPASATYTNPALTGSRLYLDLDVAKDGSFRGVWGQYSCTAYPGAYGISIHSCTRIGSNRVSGRFGPDRSGTIDLEQLGRSAFTWATPRVGELELDLPKYWRGRDAVLYQARLTRDGKGTPAAAAGTARDEGPLLSAVVLYREFKADSKTALERHGGKTIVLEGRRGTLIPLSNGGAAIHVADGFTSRALVLSFPDLKAVSAIGEGAQFRFRCTVSSFDYQYLHMENCAIVEE
jgi:uncharacterized protein (DUF1330 family)